MIIVLDEGYRKAVASRYDGHDVRYFPPTLSDPTALSALLADAEVVGFRRVLPFAVTADVLRPAKRLQFIHKSGSGADWVDVEFLSREGILHALNTGFNAVSVAEHAVVLTLLALRRTRDFLDVISSGKWVAALPGDEPLLLSGKTVGIVGIGTIGGHYAKVMQAMGTRVIAHHPNPKRALPAGVTWCDLDTLLTTSDVVSLHVPLEPRTTHMIGAREIGLMKPTAVLINTARGGVVDQAALVAALTERRIRAAGLDVFEDEPLAADSPLRTLPNVVATPHIGGVVKEIAAMQVEGTLANIDLFVAGKRPERLINPEILDDGRARARHLLAR
jgi:phosphoglycerate dehydrogenase-like enzyme